VIGLAIGCAGVPLVSGATASSIQYFAAPSADDPWTPKIAGWQRRESQDTPVVAPASVAEPGSRFASPGEGDRGLRSKYASFRAERRRTVAREFAEWIQAEAKQHYVPDGAVDHWATLEETLRKDGDDCDGLELLVFHGLRDLGFAEDEVFRAIVYRPDDGQHHMVTLWFEDRDDPWVIDPTGAMSSGMRRMSAIPGWLPLKVFSGDREFTARPGRDRSATDLAAN
jgi:predicted transglutaminase-like cysteine proteinase